MAAGATCAVGKQVGFEGTFEYCGIIIGKARDVELASSAPAVDATTKDSAGDEEVLVGIRSKTITVGQLWVFSNAGRQAIESAHLDGTVNPFKILDKDGNGYEGDAIVTDLSFGQPLGEAMVQDATLRVCGALKKVTASS